MKTEHWPRLRVLLEEALELSGEARRRYLDGLGTEDGDLRDELERLLASHHKLGSHTAPNAMDLAASSVAPRLQEEAELDQARVGQHIQSYRLVQLLGAGGMGAVYLTERRESGFTQTVALKVVRRMLGSQVARERFERERQILAGLQHPGIALLFDGGQTAEGQSFYTMEYVDGVAITDFCTEHSQSVAERVRLLLQVASTLSYAHRNLVVHRDIKPSNVLVTEDGRVKLIDFGLAKLLDEHSIPSVTQTGLGPMTPVYAAPEQFRGQATGVSTDIYQFGVLSFLLFTGSLPYRVDPNDSLAWARAVCEDESVTLMRAANAMPPVDARKGFAYSRHRLNKDLDAIVRKCLAKVPDRRYRSADALISDLEAFLAGRPVNARPAGPMYFAWRFVQRRRYAVAAVALAIAAMTIIAIAALRESQSAAEHAERAARDEQVRDITRAMLTDLLRAGPASAVSQRPRSALEVLDQGTERTLSVLASNPQHRAIAASVLAESYLELEHPRRAQDLIEKTLPIIDLGEGLGDEKLQLHLLLARAAAEQGDIAASERALHEAEETIESLGLPADAPSRLAAALVHVRIERHEGLQEHARELAAKLLGDSDRPPLNGTLEFADLLQNHATQSADTASAIAEFTRAWAIIVAHYGADSPAALNAQRYVIIKDLRGPHVLDTDTLLAQHKAQVSHAFGEDSLDYADVLTIECELRETTKDYASADTCWRQVLAIYEPAADAELLLASTYDNIASNLLRLGRPADALTFYEHELAERSKSFAPTSQNVIHSRLQIAKTRCLTGEIARATGEFNTSIVDYVASVGPLHPYEAVYAAYFATCLLDAGRVDLARSVMDRHGRLDPPRKDMTAEDRDDVQAVWTRLGP